MHTPKALEALRAVLAAGHLVGDEGEAVLEQLLHSEKPTHRFLVCAVDTHDDLVKALEDLEKTGLLDTMIAIDESSLEEGEEPIARPIVTRLRAAIMKARGTE